MPSRDRPGRRSLIVAGGPSVGAVLLVGPPVAYLSSLLTTGVYATLTRPVAVVLLAAAFVFGMWAAGEAAERLLARISMASSPR